VATEPEAEALA
jgi:hypothetical protein